MVKKWCAEEWMGRAWRWWKRMPRSRTARSLAREQIESIAPGRGGKATRDYWVRRGRWWMEWELGKVDEVGGDEPTKGG